MTKGQTGDKTKCRLLCCPIYRTLGRKGLSVRPMYFVHFLAVILSCQNCVIPLSHSSLVEGFSVV